MATTPHDRRLTEAVGTTLAQVFPGGVWRVRALRFSDLLLGLTSSSSQAAVAARLRAAPAALQPLVPRVEAGLARVVPHGRPWTDARAPVEWVTDRMLAEQIARGEGLDETLLPTAP